MSPPPDPTHTHDTAATAHHTPGEVTPTAPLSDAIPPTAPLGSALPAADVPTVPGFEILGRLGEGGMGVVWQALRPG